LWDADVVLVSGGDAVRVVVRGGRMTSVAPDTADAQPAAIRIVGPADGWAKMLLPAPPPFYQDLYGASLHHGFTLEGGIENVGPYYPALRRLIELLRTNGD
jgi:hypothetical protein